MRTLTRTRRTMLSVSEVTLTAQESRRCTASQANKASEETKSMNFITRKESVLSSNVNINLDCQRRENLNSESSSFERINQSLETVNFVTNALVSQLT